MSNYSTLAPVCNNFWARSHFFQHPDIVKKVPAICKTWDCYPCALGNIRKVYALIKAGRPQRFITLAFAGRTKESMYRHLNMLLKRIRRQPGWVFEFFAVVEIHLSGDLHLHIAQRGTFIPWKWLKKNWLEIIQDDYPGWTTVNVFVNKITGGRDAKNNDIYKYMTKYMAKSWEVTSQKSWTRVQALHPGVRHYRYSRSWALSRLPARQEPSKWVLCEEYTPRPIVGEYEPLTRQARDEELRLIAKSLSPMYAVPNGGQGRSPAVLGRMVEDHP